MASSGSPPLPSSQFRLLCLDLSVSSSLMGSTPPIALIVGLSMIWNLPHKFAAYRTESRDFARLKGDKLLSHTVHIALNVGTASTDCEWYTLP